jgi:hypothetical protein
MVTELEEAVARAMFIDYRIAQGYNDRERVGKEWDNGSAFTTRSGKDPWYRRARVAIQVIREKGLD